MRTRAENRANSLKKAVRKRRIDREISCHYEFYPMYSHLHQYSKNKIHCSCPMCAVKSRPKKYCTGTTAEYWKVSDIRKFDSMKADEREYASEQVRGNQLNGKTTQDEETVCIYTEDTTVSFLLLEHAHSKLKHYKFTFS